MATREEYERALPLLAELSEGYRAEGELEGLANCLRLVSLIYSAQAHYSADPELSRALLEKAQTALDETLSILHRIGATNAEEQIAYAAGNLARLRKDWHTTVHCSRIRVDTARRDGKRALLGSALHSLAVAYADMGDWENAVLYMRESSTEYTAIGNISFVANNATWITVWERNRTT
jgi:tetratricopeptide (TPR) repeat protein